MSLRILLSLALVLSITAPLPLSSATSPAVADYLKRLNKRYYCLSEAGLKILQCDLTAARSVGEGSLEGILPGTSHPFSLSYLGAGVLPVLTLKDGLKVPPGSAKEIEGVRMMAGGMLQLWAALTINPLFESGGDYKLKPTSDGGFQVTTKRDGVEGTLVFDSKAVATRMVGREGKQEYDMQLTFAPSEKGLVVTRIGIQEVACDVTYGQRGGLLLPTAFLFTIPNQGGDVRVLLQGENFQVNGSGGAPSVAGAPVGRDLQLIPDSRLAPGKKHFFWRVKSATATVYLLGSIHLRPTVPLEMPEFVERCFAASQYVGFESDKTDEEKTQKEVQAYLQKNYFYPEGDDLTRHLTQEEWAWVRGALVEVGLPESSAVKMKPIMLGLTLSLLAYKKEGRTYESGIDEIFLRKARAAGKPTFGMEFWWEPFQALNGLGERDQVNLLTAGYKETSIMLRKGEDLEAALTAGDTVLMESLMNSPEMSQAERRVMDILLKDRNTKWMGQMDRMLRTDKTYFVVVGAGHLVGRFGLPNWLQFKGYQVQQF